MTGPDGVTINYEFDWYGRLKSVSDPLHRVMKRYHYSTETSMNYNYLD